MCNSSTLLNRKNMPTLQAIPYNSEQCIVFKTATLLNRKNMPTLQAIPYNSEQ